MQCYFFNDTSPHTLLYEYRCFLVDYRKNCDFDVGRGDEGTLNWERGGDISARYACTYLQPDAGREQ